jgi:hypothetical protein
MHSINVIDLEGSRTVATADDLAGALARRINGSNHFLLSGVGANYPLLDVLVRDDLAMVHYFASEGAAGSQSVSTRDDLPEEVEFPENMTGEPVPMPASVVIDARTAIRCIEQFAETLSRPTLIDWVEL